MKERVVAGGWGSRGNMIERVADGAWRVAPDAAMAFTKDRGLQKNAGDAIRSMTIMVWQEIYSVMLITMFANQLNEMAALLRLLT